GHGGRDGGAGARELLEVERVAPAAAVEVVGRRGVDGRAEQLARGRAVEGAEVECGRAALTLGAGERALQRGRDAAGPRGPGEQHAGAGGAVEQRDEEVDR